MIKILKLTSIAFLLCYCTPSRMASSRVDFISNVFEIAGFYYSDPKTSYDNRSLCYIFYNNGVFFGGFSVQDGPSGIVNYLLDSSKVKSAKERPYSWGVFQVDGESINFEKWISSDAFGGYPTVKYYGKVIDNNRLLIKTPIVYSISKPPKEFKFDTLYFYSFKSKPDSINKYIK